MKRKPILLFFILIVISLLFVLADISASAESASLSVDVTGTLKAGKTFDVAVSSDIPLCALQLDIGYDAGKITYKSVKAESADGCVRYRETDGGISLIFASASPKSGTLLVCRFKPLSDGENALVFSPVSAAASDEKPVEINEAVTLKLSVGVNASFQTSAALKTATSSTAQQRRSLSESKSTDDESISREVIDLRDPYSPVLRYALITAGAASLLAVTLAVGIQIGKRYRKEPKEDTDSKKSDEHSPDDEEKS